MMSFLKLSNLTENKQIYLTADNSDENDLFRGAAEWLSVKLQLLSGG